eukprot:g1822.t1
MHHPVLVLLLPLLVSSLLVTLHVTHAKRRTAAEWNKLWSVDNDLESIEADWQAGDSEEELKTEDQYEYERIEERKAMPIPKTPNGEDPSQWMAHAAAFSGPTMVFCKLNSTLEDGSKRTKDDTDLTGARWKELLLMGGVEATPYSIEYDTVLLTLQRGWNGAQLRDFCLEQPEVVKASWDQIDYFPERLQ